MIKCREIDKPNHAHTADCESVLLEHANTGVSTLTKNVSPNEYPDFVMHAVEVSSRVSVVFFSFFNPSFLS